jgi:hypothetical protein
MVMGDTYWCQIKTALSISDIDFPKLWDGVLIDASGVWDSLSTAPWPEGWEFNGWDTTGASDPKIIFEIDSVDFFTEDNMERVMPVLQSIEENLVHTGLDCLTS